MRIASIFVILLVACGGGASDPISKDEIAMRDDDGVDYCARFGWYDDAECDTFCPLPDPDCGDEAAACLDPASADRARCCAIADYDYCSERVLASQDGEGPSLCVGIRGNGPRITAHFGALARMYEHYGLFDGVGGGSSGSISSFLVESVQMNPAVRCEDCTPFEQGARASLLFKSLLGYVGVLGASDEGLAIQSTVRFAQAASERNVEELLENDPAAGVAALQELLSSDLVGLVNREIVELLETSPNPAFHARDILGAAENAVNFALPDFRVFVRPGIVDFPNFARGLGRIGSFYAGYDPVDMGAMDYFLGECAEPARGRTWGEIAALPTSDGRTCGLIFNELLSDFRDELLADEGAYPSRADDPIGAHLPTFVSTGVLTGDAVDAFEGARAAYLEGAEAIPWDINYDDVRLGYFGQEDDLARMESNPEGYTDRKTAKFIALGTRSWADVLTLSPAEPGLARGLEIPESEHVSVGGWSDLQPVLALRNMGCEKVIYLTRVVGEPGGFATSVSNLLNVSDDERRALFSLEPESAFTRSLEEASGVWCTDWDTPSVQDLEAMTSAGYDAPLETTDPFLRAPGSYEGIVPQTGFAGCTAGAQLP